MNTRAEPESVLERDAESVQVADRLDHRQYAAGEHGVAEIQDAYDLGA